MSQFSFRECSLQSSVDLKDNYIAIVCYLNRHAFINIVCLAKTNRISSWDLAKGRATGAMAPPHAAERQNRPVNNRANAFVREFVVKALL